MKTPQIFTILFITSLLFNTSCEENTSEEPGISSTEVKDGFNEAFQTTGDYIDEEYDEFRQKRVENKIQGELIALDHKLRELEIRIQRAHREKRTENELSQLNKLHADLDHLLDVVRKLEPHNWDKNKALIKLQLSHIEEKCELYVDIINEKLESPL